MTVARATRTVRRAAGGHLRRRRHHPRELRHGRNPSPSTSSSRKPARAGLATERDAGANLVDHAAGPRPDLPFLACGSHLDSVPQGGNFDGAAGVIAGLLALCRLRAEGFVPAGRSSSMACAARKAPAFGRAYIGSSALFGRLTADDLALPHAVTGRPLSDCMRDAGADGGPRSRAARHCSTRHRRRLAGTAYRARPGPGRAPPARRGRDRHPRQCPPPRRRVHRRGRPFRRHAALAAPRRRVRHRRTDHPPRPPLAHAAGARARPGRDRRHHRHRTGGACDRPHPRPHALLLRGAQPERPKRWKPSTTCSCPNAPASPRNAASVSTSTAGWIPPRHGWMTTWIARLRAILRAMGLPDEPMPERRRPRCRGVRQCRRSQRHDLRAQRARLAQPRGSHGNGRLPARRGLARPRPARGAGPA